jgi:hypothetical protein
MMPARNREQGEKQDLELSNSEIFYVGLMQSISTRNEKI